MKTIFSILILAFGLQSLAAVSEAGTCDSAKEFITTYEFLRDDADLAAAGDNAVKVALQVAAECTGGAKRFIQTVKFLKKTEIPLHQILKTAIEFSQREDEHAEAFTQVFKVAYAEDGFDLDIGNSLKLAKQMSVEYSGPVQKALVAFQKVSEFCLNKKEIVMSRSACAELSKNVSLASTEEGPAAGDVFIRSFQFLKDPVGLTEMDALKLSQSLLKTSPSAFENFKVSYEYALSPAGLGAAKDQAIQLGKKMADFTVKKSESIQIK
jgi:hypothetical protein